MTVDRRWHQRQIALYAGQQPDYAAFADVLQRTLTAACAGIAPGAIVQTRPKSVESFAEKAVRKHDRYPDPLKQFPDLCGGRVIMHTPREVERVCAFIERTFIVDWEDSENVVRRLRLAEFGYLSVHYVVQVNPAAALPIPVEAGVLKRLLGLKAEIQVRTLLQHAWAEISHDRIYKSGFKTPARWLRDAARLAAVLENADETFERFADNVDSYAEHYAAYMTRPRMQEEIATLETILAGAPARTDIALRIGKIAIAAADYAKAVRTLSRFRATHDPQVLRELGIALCGRHRERPASAGCKRGRALLARALRLAPDDLKARVALAESWRQVDERTARRLYAEAFERDAGNPYLLAHYLEYEIDRADSMRLVRPLLAKALRRCREHATMGLELPRAFFTMGRFHFFLGEDWRGLNAYAKGVDLCLSDPGAEQLHLLAREAAALQRAPRDLANRDTIAAAGDLLRLAQAALAPAAERASRLEGARSGRKWRAPFVIVAGETRDGAGAWLAHNRGTVARGLSAFRGSLISGGTALGVSGLVGELAAKQAARVRAVGYLPRRLPRRLKRDPRYHEFRVTNGRDFGAGEPLKYWRDLLASGVDPRSVRLLGVSGGPISAFEYRLALALGATVAVIGESGRAAQELLLDEDWAGHQRLLALPADAATLQAFLCADAPALAAADTARLAHAAHAHYRAEHIADVVKRDPSLAEWGDLPPALKRSNELQAADLLRKLEAVDCELAAKPSAEIKRLRFTRREIETLAEMEHGRWNVERLADGWRAGSKDVAKKTSPYLVAWRDLPAEVKQSERESIAALPDLLARMGYEIRRRRRPGRR